jgi:hypothetical protein
MPKKQQKKKSLSSFYFPFLQPGDAIIGFLESAVPHFPRRAGAAPGGLLTPAAHQVSP